MECVQGLAVWSVYVDWRCGVYTWSLHGVLLPLWGVCLHVVCLTVQGSTETYGVTMHNTVTDCARDTYILRNVVSALCVILWYCSVLSCAGVFALCYVSFPFLCLAITIL